jgi:hypothetical protein
MSKAAATLFCICFTSQIFFLTVTLALATDYEVFVGQEGGFKAARLYMRPVDDPDIVASAFCFDNGLDAVRCSEIRAHLHDKKKHMEDSSEHALASVRTTQIGSDTVMLDGSTPMNILFRPGDILRVESIVQTFCGNHSIDSHSCDKLRARLLGVCTSAELEHIRKHLAVLSVVEDKDAIIKYVDSCLQTLISGMQGHYNQLKHAFDAKTLPLAQKLVRERQHRGELMRYFFLLVKTGALEPSTTHFPMSPFISHFWHTTRFGEPDRHGRRRIGEGARYGIDRFHVSNFSYGEYLRYASSSTPVIVQGLSEIFFEDSAGKKLQPGLPNWTYKRLRKLCGDRLLTLKTTDMNDTHSWARVKPHKKLLGAAYLEAVHLESIAPGTHHSLRSLYLHDAPLASICPKLLDDVVVPRYFSADIMQRIPSSTHRSWAGYRDYWPSIFIGGEETGSALHADWCNTQAWMGLVAGRKRWRIVHPRDRHLLHEDSLRTNVFPTDLFAPGKKNYPTVEFASVYEAILEPGEVIFVPSGAPHQVINIGQTVAVAMNYVDIAGLDKFMEQAEVFSIGTGMTDFSHMNSVRSAINGLDLRRERAMLAAAQGGDDELVNLHIPPGHMTYLDFKESIARK